MSAGTFRLNLARGHSAEIWLFHWAEMAWRENR